MAFEIQAEVETGAAWGCAEQARFFVPTGRKTKTGKDEKMPVYHRRIRTVCAATGKERVFSRMVRGGVESFGDSIQKEPGFGMTPFRRNRQELFAELARFLGAQNAQALVSVV
jgi:hypothetical protein